MVIAKSVGAQTIGTKDGSRIICRVADFRKYLIKFLGNSIIDNSNPYDSAFKGKRGIIAFSVNWQGAAGHIALWNGSTYQESSLDNYSTYVNPDRPDIKTSRVEFWELS